MMLSLTIPLGWNPVASLARVLSAGRRVAQNVHITWTISEPNLSCPTVAVTENPSFPLKLQLHLEISHRARALLPPSHG